MTLFRLFVGATMGLACTVPACVTNHDGLAAQDPDGTGGSSSGGAGSGGIGGRYVLPDGHVGASGGALSGEAGPKDTGPRTLTVLHGVVDSPWIALCFGTLGANDDVTFSGAPLPPGGLDYGHGFAVDQVLDAPLGAADLRPYLVAAASESVARGASCADLVARGSLVAASAALPDASSAEPGDATTSMDTALRDGSLEDGSNKDAATTDAGPVPIAPVRVTALPIVPKAAFAASRSFLLTLAGCMGGAGVTDPSEQSVCGQGYTPSAPTLTEIVVELSRITRSGHVGLSFLAASPALPVATLVLQPALPADPIPVADDVEPGSLRPPSPDTANKVSDLTTGAPDAKIELSTEGSRDLIYDEPWAPTLVAGGLTALENGKNYTLVLVGPYPGFSKRRWWNDPLVTLVDDAPAPPQ